MASTTSKTLSFPASASKRNGPKLKPGSPAHKAMLSKRAKAAAATRKRTTTTVLIGGKRTKVNASQLAGLKAAASKRANGSASKAAAKAAATKRANGSKGKGKAAAKG